MMKQEFEALAGYEVSFEDYNNIIEPMYMATEMSKWDFVKCIDKKRFALHTEKQLKAAMVKEARHLMETTEHYTDFESYDRLNEIAKEYAERFWGTKEFDFKKSYMGDWFWNAPGRGCSFPTELILFNNNATAVIGSVELLNKEKELAKLA